MNILTDNKIQILADLISIAFGSDTAVVSKDYMAVAGTGKFRKFIGKVRPPDTFLANQMHTGEPFIIENATYERNCYKCSFRSECFYSMVIGAPIISNNEIMGSVALLATNKDHRQNIFTKRHQLRKDLPTISNFFSDVLSPTVTIKDTVLELIDDSIIITNANGEIVELNQAAEHLIKCRKKEIIGHDIYSVISEFNIKQNIHCLFKNNLNQVSIKNRFMNFIAKPINVNNHTIGHVIRINQLGYKTKSANYSKRSNEEEHFGHIIGESLSLKRCIQNMQKIAETDSIVLIQGETGTGKELFAHGIHNMSKRSEKPLVIINCGALPDNLLESELFGYEEGAFTGAKKGGKIGKFELANHGTLFLDEIGELPFSLQSKLLRVLEDGRLEKVGGQSTITLDVRIIAATNRNLSEMVSRGTFRNDLFYRLNIFPINIPPLRDRKSDIPLLINHFTSLYAATSGCKPIALSSDIEQFFLNYDWPGNIRELKNVLYYCFQVRTGDIILVNDLPDAMKELYYSQSYSQSIIHRGLKSFERSAIEEALSIFGTSTKGKEKIAKSLGMSLTTLYRRLDYYNLRDIKTKKRKNISVLVKSCDACNPRIDTKKATEEFFNKTSPWGTYEVQNPPVDVVLIVNGCENACADNDNNRFLAPEYFSIKGIWGDINLILMQLNKSIKLKISRKSISAVDL